MQSISRIMRGVNPALLQTEQEPDDGPTGYVMSNDPAAAGHNPPEPVPCEFCGAMRYTKGYFLYGKARWNFCGPEPCTCPEAVAANEAEKAQREAEKQAEREAEAARRLKDRVRRLVGDSGMNSRFLQRTFAVTKITPENRAAVRLCKQYADTFRDKLPRNNPTPGRNGLFIMGPMGTGKTHLAASIANKLIQEGTPVICMTMIDLLERIKQTYAQHQTTDSVTEGNILGTYKDVPLLIIDDMGKEPATDWAVSKVYSIINARYESLMPTIITTNYTDAELEYRLTPKNGDARTAEATIDRLREMCEVIMTTGDSWRGR